ncbi:ABC transporter permease [Horticoccus luteus]|uniref:Transport permease protein n=1 Tax=Horticoccus luteus TaxID=2862869 RepID=A0A8F9TXX8_9BACT|nr:ABC transporter permease [Horticoccus luteus]QYM79788.1 ABC transporter permease [Horticoccus luteus]
MSAPLTAPAPAASGFLAHGNFIGSMWRFRGLLWQFTLRNVELRHRGSHLGLVWSVLNPLLMLALYVLVFGYIFRGRFNAAHPESRMDYALGIFLGLTLFHLFAEVLGVAPMIIITNPNFVKKVVFPLEILPAAAVSSAFFHMLISLALALTGIALFGPGLGWSVFWLPVILLPVLLLLLGTAWMIAAVGVFFRDISQVMGFVSMALMYASAVVYPASAIPHSVWVWLRFNPMLLAVELSRDVVMWDRPMHFTYLAYLFATGLLASAGGFWIFSKLKPTFADVV